MATKRKMTKKQIVRALIRIARQSWRAAPFGIICKLAGAIIDAVLPLVVAYFAAQTTTALAAAYAGDRIAGERAIEFVVVTAAIGLFGLVWSSISRYINEYAEFKIKTMASDTLLEKFAILEYWRYDDKDTADLYDQAENFTFYFSRIFNDLATVFTAVIQITIALVTLAFLHWWYGVILLAAMLPSALVQSKLSRLQAQYWRNNVATRRTANDIRWYVFQPSRLAETRMYGLIGHLMKLYRSLRNDDQRQQLAYERKFLVLRVMSSAIESIGELAILLATVLQIAARIVPIGQFVYVQQLVSRAMASASNISSTISGMDENISTLYDYEQFLALPDTATLTKRAPRMPQKITFNKVSFAYPLTEKTVLHDISFTIFAGSHVAFVGENGAGKSTVIKLLIGQYNPSNGQVLLDDTDMSTIAPESWQRQLSVLVQDFSGYNFATARENVQYGDIAVPFNETRYNDALVRAEAADFIRHLPKKDDTIMSKWLEHDDGTKGTNLSGGQWQRLVLARNFYRDTPYLVLDEPASAIDALAESRIFKRLFETHNKTVITVSHRLSTVKRADVIYMMEKGKIAEQGTYDQLLAKRGKFYTMFESQL